MSAYIGVYNNVTYYNHLGGRNGGDGLQGVQGESGNQGSAGPTGKQGEQGLQGLTGIIGSQGSQGIQGPQGPQGPTGNQGPQGPQGNQGPIGSIGPRGDTGPPMSIPISGINNSDYLYWNNGQWTVGSQSVNLGANAGSVGSGGYNVAIGYQAGMVNQGTGSVSLGSGAGKYNQGMYSVAIGTDAGSTGQGNYSVAIGSNASNGGCTGSVALGYNSLNTNSNQIMLGTSAESVSFAGKLLTNLISVSSDDPMLNTECYIPFMKPNSSSATIMIDNPIGPLTYNPSTSTLNAVNITASSMVTTPNISLQNMYTNSYSANSITENVFIADSQTTGELQMGTAHTTGNINIGNGTGWDGGSINIASGAFSGATGCTLNIMTGENTGPGKVNIGGSSDTVLNINSKAVFVETMSTSTSVPPSVSNSLGYRIVLPFSFLSPFSGAFNGVGPTSVSRIVVDGTTIPYGTYLVQVTAYLLHTHPARAGYSLGINSTQNSSIISVPYVKSYYDSQDGIPMTNTQVLKLYSSKTLYIAIKSDINITSATLVKSPLSSITLVRLV